MTIAYVTGSFSSGIQSTSSATYTCTNAAAQSIGDCYVVICNVNSGSVTVTSVTDSAGNAYTPQIGPTINTTLTQYLFTSILTAASAVGANTLTVHLSGTITGSDVNQAGYSGVNSVGNTNAATGNTATASAGVSVTVSGSAVVAGAFVGSSVTGVGGGATNRGTNSNGNNLEDVLNTSIGTVTPTATFTSAEWIFSAVVLQPSQVVQPTNFLHARVRPIGI